MKIKLEGYNEGFKIVSLAFDDEARQDLREDELDFLYVSEDGAILYPLNKEFYLDENSLAELKNFMNYDVFEIWTDGTLAECYSNDSTDNYFFVTGKCNSNCIMCPSADFSRERAERAHVDELIEIARHIPTDAEHLTITGGEPFMAGEELFRFLEFLKGKFTYTEFLILTNGRIFSVTQYADLFAATRPDNCIVGIPIHGANATVHDNITRAPCSFAQTVAGIKNLLKSNSRVELRMVVCKENLRNFDDMARFVINELHGIEYVCIMAMEMTGNAFVNRERVWVPYSDAFQAIEHSISLLLESGIDVRLYNFPLCTVAKRYWTLCEKSISPNKVRFSDCCNACKYKADCGGIFYGTYLLEKDDLKAIV